MGCYLEDYRARMGTWAAGTLWATRTMWRNSQVNGRLTSNLGTMILCATTLAVLLVIWGAGAWRKFLDLVWGLRKFCKFCVASATEISIMSWEMSTIL